MLQLAALCALDCSNPNMLWFMTDQIKKATQEHHFAL